MVLVEFAMFSIVIGSVVVGSMIFVEENDLTLKNEPSKHPNFEPNSKYDIDKTGNSYQGHIENDDIFFDSKRHHPRALEEVASYKYEF
jgi:hypothetical protein